MANVLYLCNKQNEKCKDSQFCYVDCFNTQFERFALNGPCDDPEKEPERLEMADLVQTTSMYILNSLFSASLSSFEGSTDTEG